MAKNRILITQPTKTSKEIADTITTLSFDVMYTFEIKRMPEYQECLEMIEEALKRYRHAMKVKTDYFQNPKDIAELLIDNIVEEAIYNAR